MINIVKYFYDIAKYELLSKYCCFPDHYGCGLCGFKGRLYHHGYYERNAIFSDKTYRINIPRFKCPSCKKYTCSNLPSFLAPYRQYSIKFILSCLEYLYINHYSYTKIVDIFKNLNQSTYFNKANIYYFKQRMLQVLSKINSFIANFHEYHFSMDNYTISSILQKIIQFNQCNDDFSYTYFTFMTTCFFEKCK